ncbi:MAG: prephenate dehydratase [Candidatus Cryptobacteroides sp.]
MGKRVAIQGFHGSFHEEAAYEFYRQRGESEPEIVECATFEEMFVALQQGEADALIIAVENTTSGGLLANFDLLRRYDKRVKGEIYLHIHQNLMAIKGQSLEDIREVRTHYMAINQTRQFFESECPWIKVVESEDTAKSAAELADSGAMGVGAVASAVAAKSFGLEILKANIETFQENFTRFLIVDDEIEVDLAKVNKSSICFTLPHKPGSLAHILTILSFYDMNLSRIQSLPIPGKKWQYFFYADITFDSYERYNQALAAVRPLVEDLDIMGEYVSEPEQI